MENEGMDFQIECPICHMKFVPSKDSIILMTIHDKPIFINIECPACKFKRIAVDWIEQNNPNYKK